MINDIRKLAGGIASKLMLAVLFVAMCLWGVSDVLQPGSSRSSVATIGDYSISAAQFRSELRDEQENFRRMLGANYSDDIVKSLNLPYRVLQRLIRQELLRLEADVLQLSPSDADVVRQITETRTFHDKQGHFDKNTFRAVLNNMGMSEKQYIEKLRSQISSELLVSAFLGNVPVSDTAARTLYQAREEKRVATLYTLPASLVGSLPEPSTQQLEAYYKERSAQFVAPEYRALSYIVIEPKQVTDSIKITDEMLQKTYDERIDEFKRPEMRTLEQMLFAEEAEAETAYEALKAGKSFAKVAASSNILNKGSTALGSIDKSALNESVGDAAFFLKQGDYTQPVKSLFGWHIFNVLKIEPAYTMTLEQARPALENDLKQQLSSEALHNLANSLEDSFAGGSTLAEVAQSLGVKVVSIPAINASGLTAGGAQPKEIPAFPDFLENAFKLDEKTESQLIPTKDGGYYIIRVENITPEREKPLAEVKDAATNGWKQNERKRLLAELAQEVADKFADSTQRKALIEKYRLQGSSSGALKRIPAENKDNQLPPALLEEIFMLTPSQSSKAYPMENGSYSIAVVGDIISATPLDQSAQSAALLAKTRESLSAEAKSELIEQYIAYLQDKYSIKINQEALSAFEQH